MTGGSIIVEATEDERLVGRKIGGLGRPRGGRRFFSRNDGAPRILKNLKIER